MAPWRSAETPPSPGVLWSQREGRTQRQRSHRPGTQTSGSLLQDRTVARSPPRRDAVLHPNDVGARAVLSISSVDRWKAGGQWAAYAAEVARRGTTLQN